jgi:hypothetical protein
MQKASTNDGVTTTNTPQRRNTFLQRLFTDDELIKKKDIFDPIEDDDDVDRKHNPFNVDSLDAMGETPEQLMSQIIFK